jgi:hypothetical protein
VRFARGPLAHVVRHLVDATPEPRPGVIEAVREGGPLALRWLHLVCPVRACEGSHPRSRRDVEHRRQEPDRCRPGGQQYQPVAKRLDRPTLQPRQLRRVLPKCAAASAPRTRMARRRQRAGPRQRCAGDERLSSKRRPLLHRQSLRDWCGAEIAQDKGAATAGANSPGVWTQDDSGRVRTPLEPLVLAATVALIPVLILENAASGAWQTAAFIGNWLIWAVFAFELGAVLVVAPEGEPRFERTGSTLPSSRSPFLSTASSSPHCDSSAFSACSALSRSFRGRYRQSAD